MNLILFSSNCGEVSILMVLLRRQYMPPRGPSFLLLFVGEVLNLHFIFIFMIASLSIAIPAASKV